MSISQRSDEPTRDNLDQEDPVIFFSSAGADHLKMCLCVCVFARNRRHLCAMVSDYRRRSDLFQFGWRSLSQDVCVFARAIAGTCVVASGRSLLNFISVPDSCILHIWQVVGKYSCIKVVGKYFLHLRGLVLLTRVPRALSIARRPALLLGHGVCFPGSARRLQGHARRYRSFGCSL